MEWAAIAPLTMCCGVRIFCGITFLQQPSIWVSARGIPHFYSSPQSPQGRPLLVNNCIPGEIVDLLLKSFAFAI